MSAFATPPPPVADLRYRSAGAKFFLVLLLAFGMSLSGFFVDNLNDERAQNHGVLNATWDNATEHPTSIGGIHLVDSYRSTRRSLHYIPLFLGLVFLTYFLFEVTIGKSVHPAQYALVGVAQLVFYLLLLSLAEHLGFDWSFLIAGACTVALFSINTEWLFRSRKRAQQALGIFTLLYGFIYVLLRVESYALLVGAVASFAAVSTAMYLTRNVDWYGNGVASAATASASPSRSSWLD